MKNLQKFILVSVWFALGFFGLIGPKVPQTLAYDNAQCWFSIVPEGSATILDQDRLENIKPDRNPTLTNKVPIPADKPVKFIVGFDLDHDSGDDDYDTDCGRVSNNDDSPYLNVYKGTKIFERKVEFQYCDDLYEGEKRVGVRASSIYTFTVADLIEDMEKYGGRTSLRFEIRESESFATDEDTGDKKWCEVSLNNFISELYDGPKSGLLCSRVVDCHTYEGAAGKQVCQGVIDGGGTCGRIDGLDPQKCSTCQVCDPNVCAAGCIQNPVTHPACSNVPSGCVRDGLCSAYENTINCPSDCLGINIAYDLCLQIAEGTSERSLCERCSTHEDGIWTAFGCIKTDFVSVVSGLLSTGLSIGGGVSLLMLLLGAFTYTTSRGEPKRTTEAKERITAAIIGLLFIIFSVAILRFIGITVLQLPGFDNIGG